MADEPEEPGGRNAARGRPGDEDGDCRGRGRKSRRSPSSPSARTSRRPRAGRRAGAPRWPAPTRRCSGRPTRSIPSFSASAPRARASRSSCGAPRPARAGFVHDLVRDRQALVARPARSWRPGPIRSCAGVPATFRACLAVPLEAEGIVVGLLALFFDADAPTPTRRLARLERFLEQAAPALGRALRSERKTVGMLHAIERLTNLYDLSKAFGSTIDIDELVRRSSSARPPTSRPPRSRRSGCSTARRARSRWRRPRSTRTTTWRRRPTPSAPRSSATSSRTRRTVRRNRIPDSDPLAGENEGYPDPLGPRRAARRGRGRASARSCSPTSAAATPSSPPRTRSCSQDLARQAVRALRTARQHEAEKKVEELDALLAVSREITSTLDLDKVMKTVVNATSALIAYDRCGIAILAEGQAAPRGDLGLDGDRPQGPGRPADGGAAPVGLPLGQRHVRRRRTEDGEITADRPETEEKFRALFQETGLRSFFGVLLKDEEGKLGALAFESKEPCCFDEETRDLLSILVNQATVAVRNAQLYQQVPLAGFWKPLLEKRRKLVGRSRSAGAGLGDRRRCVAALAALRRPLAPADRRARRASFPAAGRPSRRSSTASSRRSCTARATRVQAGEVIATLKDESYAADLAAARAALRDRRERRRPRAAARATPAAHLRRPSAPARRPRRAGSRSRRPPGRRTRLRAPAAGVIVTPRIEERVGQLARARRRVLRGRRRPAASRPRSRSPSPTPPSCRPGSRRRSSSTPIPAARSAARRAGGARASARRARTGS